MQIFTQPVAPKTTKTTTTTTTITESVETPEPTIDSIDVIPIPVTELPLSANVLTQFPLPELKTILHDINNRLTNIEALLQNHWAETTINVENINALDQTITNTLEIRSQE